MSFIPVTPAGTLVVGLAAETREEAISRLLFDASHMPYRNWKAFQRRGYTIEEVPEIDAEYPPSWAGYGMSNGHQYKPTRAARSAS